MSLKGTIRKRKLKKAMRFVLPIVVLIAAVVIFRSQIFGWIMDRGFQSHDSIDTIQKSVDAMDYDKAGKLIRNGLKDNPDNADLKKWQAQLMDELKVELKIRNLLDQEADYLSEQLILTSEDPYYVNLHTSDQCYVYIFQLDSSKKLVQLVPNPMFTKNNNPISSGQLIIPASPAFFHLDDTVGSETIYLVASRWRQKKLEDFKINIGSDINKKTKNGLAKQFLSLMNKYDKSTDKLPGLVFGKIKFIHK